MTYHQITTTRSSWREVVDWRRSRLVDAGFPTGLAGELAEDGGVDLHAILDLIDRGCPPELAARILAPIDASGSAQA